MGFLSLGPHCQLYSNINFVSNLRNHIAFSTFSEFTLDLKLLSIFDNAIILSTMGLASQLA